MHTPCPRGTARAWTRRNHAVFHRLSARLLSQGRLGMHLGAHGTHTSSNAGAEKRPSPSAGTEAQHDGVNTACRQHEAASVQSGGGNVRPLPPPPTGDELRSGRLWDTARAAFPTVPWGPAALAKVLGASVLGLSLLSAASSSQALGGAVGGFISPSDTQAAAVLHVAREAGLLGLTAGLLGWALRDTSPRRAGLFQYTVDGPWLSTTALVCAVLFYPLADPLLSSLSKRLAEATGASDAAAALIALLKPDDGTVPTTAAASTAAAAAAAATDLAGQVKVCAAEGAWGALAAHLLASGLLGPLWEETFWRGFFLTSLTRVLPLPGCVALSATWFTALHLNPGNALPILLLAAASDVLYLRSASLGPPLMLHAAWNSSQLLAVALLGKDAFV